MLNIKPTTIFPKIPFISSYKAEKDREKRKVSYWLEKLHTQREDIRQDNNRREEQSKIDERKQPVHNQLPSKKVQDLAQSGINEQTKNMAIKKEADTQTVNDLVKKSNRRIISVSGTFPWDFFPDMIDVEESRVTFVFRQFLSSQSHSVEIKDISNVFIDFSLFFATIQVVSRTYIQNDIKIRYLNKEKAQKVQQIIEGLRTFIENDVNTSNYEIDELVLKIEEFHANHTVPQL